VVTEFQIDLRRTFGVLMSSSSDTGTNLKVTGARPVQSAGKNVIYLHFLALQVRLVVFGMRYRDGQYS